MYEYRAQLKRVVDGDTVDLIIDLGFRMTTGQRVRLKGINTPETWHVKKDSAEYRAGKKAAEFVMNRFRLNKNSCIVKTDKDPGIYGRFIGTILFPDNEVSLNEELLNKGYAEPYI
jgi:micrococcal nuclease